MIPLNKRKIKFTKIRKSKTNSNFENSFQSFSKIPRTETFTNEPNTRYFQPNYHNIYHSNTNTNPNINWRDIKEIDIKYIPNEILSQNKPNRHQRNKIKNSNPIKTISSFSNDNISDNSFLKYQNNTFTQRTIETYEIPLGKRYHLNQQFHNRLKQRENKSMDITYYKPIIYINKNENNNSFCKNPDYSDFFTQNNSFIMNGTNVEDNIPNINLNKTIDCNKENYLRQKNITTSIYSIPRPRKYRKRIPPIPIKKINESNNNSFYFEENDIINNNINTNTNPNYVTIKVKHGLSSDKNKLESTKANTNKVFKNNNKKYSNKTYSMGYIKNIEKIGIQFSFSNNKLKNESIDLISPEILKSLKQYSSEKSEREAVYSDLHTNKIKEFNNSDKNKNIQIIYNLGEDYEKMRKKYYNKLSCYLLKNKKRRISQKLSKKEKYNIVDIKEKIKEEKRNRSLSNLFKYKKKAIIKDSPSATNIKKQDDIGGKVDLKIQNIKNKRYGIKKGIKRKMILTNLIKQCKINKSPQDQGEVIINAAKTIQKWWRDLLYKIFIILNIIKIQSVFRSFITRKGFKENKNTNKKKDNPISSKRIKNMIYKKIIANSQSINSNHNTYNKKSRNSKKLENIISNSSFKIISNEEINSTIKNDEEKNPILIMDKKNLKLCFYTKDYYQNTGEKNIIFIQKYFKNYLNHIIKQKNKKILKRPMMSLSFIEKTKYKSNKSNNDPLIIKPVISISVFTKNNIFLKKKKPIVFSVSKMNYESISTKKETTQNLINDSSDKNIKQNDLLIKEEIYQIPVLNNLCYLNKICINKNDKAEEKINIIQRKYKNIINKKEKENQRIFKKNIILISYISKQSKDSLINSDKISLIQNKFRQYNNKRKEKENKLILEEKNKKEIQKYENINHIITKLIEKHSIKYAFNKLRKAIKLSKEKYFLKMLSQRIKKIINQFTFHKFKLNDIDTILKKNMMKKLENKDNNEARISDENTKIKIKIKDDNNDFDTEKDIFFFNTIKRHIKINEIDNNLDSDNEIVSLLKESIPDYFESYPKMNYIPYIKKKNEKNLINHQIFLFDDDKLAKYIYNCYKIEKNILSITPKVIKKRLILEPLKNQNIFTITRYMDNLYNDYMKNNVCKNCFCKNNDLCLSGCKCHNVNNLKFNVLHNKDNNNDVEHENDNDSLNANLNINLTINEESSYRDSRKLRNKKLKRYEDKNSFDSNLENNKKFNTYSKDNNSQQKIINDDDLDKNSINTEYNNKNNNHKKINNFIRNFAIRKKLRNSNLSNLSNQNEETINLNFNLNNKNNTIPIDDFDQSNVHEDVVLENSNKKINKSLLKKKMKTIEPIPNHVRNLMKMAKNFRNYRKEVRKKKKETIKLRDSFVNLDYEYYDNI